MSIKTELIDLRTNLVLCFKEIDWEFLKKPILLMFGIYLLGITSIMRADFLYIDESEIAVKDKRGFGQLFSRHIQWLVQEFSQINTDMVNVSPLFQIIGVFLLAVSSVLLIYIIFDKRITILRLLAAIPFGLSPFMLQPLSYGTSALVFCLPILFCIVPFLFMRTHQTFIFVSILMLLMMCNTYQAYSGLYLIIAGILCFKWWNSKSKSNKDILIFAGISICSFCIALIIYKAFFVIEINTYASSAMLSIDKLPSGIIKNIHQYLNQAYSGFNIVWRTLFWLICGLFVIKSMVESKQNKSIALFVSILVLIILSILSAGAYLVLEKPLWYVKDNARGLVTFGCFIAIINLYIISNKMKINAIAALCLSWSFFVFAFAYGNALSSQKQYNNFRSEILLSDLNSLLSDNKNKERIQVKFFNRVDFAPAVKHIMKVYPVIRNMLVPGLTSPGAGFYGEQYIFDHFDFNAVRDRDIPKDLPIVLDSYYHTIRSDGKRIAVVFKR
ncbi:MAG: glucosyltransferase domain-containing protein [Elusimicrobiota bacterium]|jgi:hypothetical protein|nr:glucosyltransferase domain-containing protein [Elusimicrobiota bacterium]